jgi:two-component system nitrate/nitrite response regulator NarL
VAELARALNPAAIILDKALGTPVLMEWLRQAASLGCLGAPVVWGAGINEPEALRFLQAGARGILRRTSESETMLTCLRAVTSGSTWMEDGIFGNAGKLMQPRRSHLTPREHQIAELVEGGLRNRDIGRALGIQTGTVKIHLKHIFEKTGVRGRYGLALTGLREKGTLSFPPPVLQFPTM